MIRLKRLETHELNDETSRVSLTYESPKSGATLTRVLDLPSKTTLRDLRRGLHRLFYEVRLVEGGR